MWRGVICVAAAACLTAWLWCFADLGFALEAIFGTCRYAGLAAAVGQTGRWFDRLAASGSVAFGAPLAALAWRLWRRRLAGRRGHGFQVLRPPRGHTSGDGAARH